jgi:hypothetical protein
LVFGRSGDALATILMEGRRSFSATDKPKKTMVILVQGCFPRLLSCHPSDTPPHVGPVGPFFLVRSLRKTVQTLESLKTFILRFLPAIGLAIFCETVGVHLNE